MKPLVVDASVVVKALVTERGSAAAVDVLRRADAVMAPQLIHAECANALWKRVHRGLATPEDLGVPLGTLLSLAVHSLELRDLTASALALALEFDHPVYDCYYLAAAIQNGARLATADESLYGLALRAGLGDRAILVRD